MLFEINRETGALNRVRSEWVPRELELERHLITQGEDGESVLSTAVFWEPLLVLSNQVRTRAQKRADIVALDRGGNGVIIELKRNAGRLGVETQALQYLADFAHYRGKRFLDKFEGVSKDVILGFLGHEANIDDLNQHSRVILVAQSFDETVFSMGEWLSSKGIAFRCIAYTPVEIGDAQFLSFSVAFDRSPSGLFPVTFASGAREPGLFWHNIGRTDPNWWEYLVAHGQIPASFDNAPGDPGEKILTSYVAGDRIVAYAKRFGAVGWGVIEDPASYRLVSRGSPDDVLPDGQLRHRLGVQWKATASNVSEGLPAEKIRTDFGIYHPISTSVSMDPTAGGKLLKALTDRFNK